MMTKFNIRFPVLLALSALMLAACSLGKSRVTRSSSSSASDTTTGTSPCKNVDICTVIPESQVNASLGVTARFTTPDEPTNMGGMTSDRCSYNAGASEPGMHVELLRQCYPDATFASAQYESSKESYLSPGATRAEMSGVGEKAFYETVPGMEGTTLPPKVRLVAFKGNVYVILSDSYAPADKDAMVKLGLTSFANMLLK